MANKTLAPGNSDANLFPEQFTQLQQCNVDAMTAASRAAIEGVQRVALWHKQMLDRYVAMANEDCQAFARAQTPEAQAAFKAEFMKRAYTRVVEDMRELRELTQGANTEAMDALQRRIAEAMDELSKLASPITVP